MIVRFEIEDEKQRDTIINCLNVMNVKYTATSKEEVNEYLGANPAFLLACKVAKGGVTEFLKQNRDSLVKPIDETKFTYDIARILVNNNLLVNYNGVKNCILDYLMKEGFLL